MYLHDLDNFMMYGVWHLHVLQFVVRGRVMPTHALDSIAAASQQ